MMPSVTDTIVPTLRASVADLKFSIRCLIRSLISDALMDMCVLSRKANSLCGQFVGDALEARAERAVDHQVARRACTAPPISAGRSRQCRRTLRFRRLLQRRRRAVCCCASSSGAAEVTVTSTTPSASSFSRSNSAEISGRNARRPVLGQRAHEVAPCSPSRAPPTLDEQLRQLRRRHVRVAEQARHARILHHLCGDLERVGPGAEGVIAASPPRRRPARRAVAMVSLSAMACYAFRSASRACRAARRAARHRSRARAASRPRRPRSRPLRLRRLSRARVVSSSICCCAAATRRAPSRARRALGLLPRSRWRGAAPGR